MKLCEHIAPLYQNEIKNGNEPVFVGVPKPDDLYASAKIFVIFKNVLGNYQDSIVEKYKDVDCHYPCEIGYFCKKCHSYISGPMKENQHIKYVRTKRDIPQKEFVAMKDNLYVEDGAYGKFIVPIDQWKE